MLILLPFFQQNKQKGESVSEAESVVATSDVSDNVYEVYNITYSNKFCYDTLILKNINFVAFLPAE